MEAYDIKQLFNMDEKIQTEQVLMVNGNISVSYGQAAVGKSYWIRVDTDVEIQDQTDLVEVIADELFKNNTDVNKKFIVNCVFDPRIDAWVATLRLINEQIPTLPTF